ncbi:AMP-binding protein [Agarivorans aestuarii]|uniref:AMP-binding protein n=1 Tax=Agarivorans aestuarii TaxID=1563703 RepID=UPI001C8142D6|nr:AMP-binding protein [Agarivorans aestuarii]
MYKNLEQAVTVFADRIALGFDGDVSFRSLINAAQELRRVRPARDKIVVSFENIHQFVTELLAFDGHVAHLLLLPDGVNAEEALRRIDIDKQSANPQETKWWFASSGTTGIPSWNAHTLQQLSRAVVTGEVQNDLCWGLLYQATRFAGIQVVLQSLLSGAKLVDAVNANPQTSLDIMLTNGVDAISATPSIYRRLMMAEGIDSLHPKFVSLGGEIAEQSLLDQVTGLFPKAKVSHIFAASELGVGFAVSDGQAGFPLTWLNNAKRFPMLSIDSDDCLLLKVNAEQEYVNTGDKVAVKEGRVYFQGRSSGLINVGGNKVYPEYIEDVLHQSPLVLHARVYPKSNPIMGQLVAADIVCTEKDPKLAQQHILEHCNRSLQRYQIPMFFRWLDSIDIALTGKVKRNE